MSRIVNIPFGAWAALGVVVFVLSIVALAASLERAIDETYRSVQIMRACEQQGGIYLDGTCKRPSEVIQPQ